MVMLRPRRFRARLWSGSAGAQAFRERLRSGFAPFPSVRGRAARFPRLRAQRAYCSSRLVRDLRARRQKRRRLRRRCLCGALPRQIPHIRQARFRLIQGLRAFLRKGRARSWCLRRRARSRRPRILRLQRRAARLRLRGVRRERSGFSAGLRAILPTSLRLSSARRVAAQALRARRLQTRAQTSSTGRFPSMRCRLSRGEER